MSDLERAAYERYVAYLEGVLCVLADGQTWTRIAYERNTAFDELRDALYERDMLEGEED